MRHGSVFEKINWIEIGVLISIIVCSASPLLASDVKTDVKIPIISVTPPPSTSLLSISAVDLFSDKVMPEIAIPLKPISAAPLRESKEVPGPLKMDSNAINKDAVGDLVTDPTIPIRPQGVQVASSIAGEAVKTTKIGDYKLNQILVSRNRKLAVINGEILSIGDSLDDVKVVDITEDTVTLKGPDGDIKLSIIGKSIRTKHVDTESSKNINGLGVGLKKIAKEKTSDQAVDSGIDKQKGQLPEVEPLRPSIAPEMAK